MINGVGTDLVAVTAFGLTTALTYDFSGLVDWPRAGIFFVGGMPGIAIAKRLSGIGARTTVFAALIFVVAATSPGKAPRRCNKAISILFAYANQ